MGPPQGECKPSSTLPGKGHFILTSGDRGIRQGQMGKEEEVLAGPHTPHSTCWT